MQDMIFCTPTELKLQNLVDCLLEAGYEAKINKDGISTTMLAFYNAEYQGKVNKTYARWEYLEEGLLGFESEQRTKFQSQRADLKSLIAINYNFITIPYLLPLLKAMLKCFDGFIYCEGEVFDLRNVDEMQYVKIRQGE